MTRLICKRKYTLWLAVVLAMLFTAVLFAGCSGDKTPPGPTGEPSESPSGSDTGSPSASPSGSPSASPSAEPSGEEVIIAPEIKIKEDYTSDTIKNADGDILVTYTSAVPVLPDDAGAGAAKINSFYSDAQADFMYFARSELKDIALANLEAFREQGIPYTPCSANQNFTVQYSRNEYISVSRFITSFMGSSRVDAAALGETFRLEDGSRVQLSDLFTVDESVYLPKLFSLIVEEIEKAGGSDAGYYEDYKGLVEEYFNPDSFYITQEGISIIYPPITVAPSMLGVCIFEVSYADLSDSIDLSFWE